MNLSNKVMLITYPDSLGSNLQELKEILNSDFKGAIGGIHILPFFPSSGDRGFAPLTYQKVDNKFGSWKDIENLSKDYYLMFDLMINHLSRQSHEFQDFLANGNNSKYAKMFIDLDKFWPSERPNVDDIEKIYKRKDKAPFQTVTLADGTKRQLWNTFGPEQLDLNLNTDITRKFLSNSLVAFSQHGASIVRLDAFAYAIKKIDTNDFFVEPDIWKLLDDLKEQAQRNNLLILPEIHEHYTLSQKVNENGYYTYDFALPMLVLYTLYSHNPHPLLKWLQESPMYQFTTLDTHDGLGVVDVKDILSDEQISYTTQQLYKRGSNVKRAYSSAAYNNLDIYQINTTYYSALGEDDKAYLLARAIQIFAPGIPQVYYVGLLAGKNDLELLEKTKEGRNINRHYYSNNEVQNQLKRPVVRKLLHLLEFRNECPAFDLDGTISIIENKDRFSILRSNANNSIMAKLEVDLGNNDFELYLNNQIVSI
ncbi:MAG: sucrose phosphorylase [Lactobacillus sp.]|uniref:sucrose phosphorylase n=1 Tax=Bombilactobacillus bombi TaxID=1303590 RepID=UPI0035E601D9|nr:sucrose phosphorylase [Lactobacillus sp.]